MISKQTPRSQQDIKNNGDTPALAGKTCMINGIIIHFNSTGEIPEIDLRKILNQH